MYRIILNGTQVYDVDNERIVTEKCMRNMGLCVDKQDEPVKYGLLCIDEDDNVHVAVDYATLQCRVEKIRLTELQEKLGFDSSNISGVGRCINYTNHPLQEIMGVPVLKCKNLPQDAVEAFVSKALGIIQRGKIQFCGDGSMDFMVQLNDCSDTFTKEYHMNEYLYTSLYTALWKALPKASFGLCVRSDLTWCDLWEQDSKKCYEGILIANRPMEYFTPLYGVQEVAVKEYRQLISKELMVIATIPADDDTDIEYEEEKELSIGSVSESGEALLVKAEHRVTEADVKFNGFQLLFDLMIDDKLRIDGVQCEVLDLSGLIVGRWTKLTFANMPNLRTVIGVNEDCVRWSTVTIENCPNLVVPDNWRYVEQK